MFLQSDQVGLHGRHRVVERSDRVISVGDLNVHGVDDHRGADRDPSCSAGTGKFRFLRWAHRLLLGFLDLFDFLRAPHCGLCAGGSGTSMSSRVS